MSNPHTEVHINKVLPRFALIRMRNLTTTSVFLFDSFLDLIISMVNFSVFFAAQILRGISRSLSLSVIMCLNVRKKVRDYDSTLNWANLFLVVYVLWHLFTNNPFTILAHSLCLCRTQNKRANVPFFCSVTQQTTF